jgi:ABC-type branched-subunit amino acid transport system substrate-binding protein
VCYRQINAKGEVGGKLKLQVITEDGKSDRLSAVVASVLINKNVSSAYRRATRTSESRQPRSSRRPRSRS